MPTINELTGCCSYPWYGGGGNFTSGFPPMRVKGLDIVKGANDTRICTIDKLYPFKLQRFFVDNSIFRNRFAPTLECEPTPGGSFYYDTYFKLCKANGIATWWVPSGVFAWYDMPVNPSTGKAYSRRKSLPIPHYANGTHADPFTKEAWDDIAAHCGSIAKHYNGTGLLDYLELVGNEVYDFPWNTLLTGTPEIVAEGVYWCYKAVRAVNTELKLILPSGTSWNIDRLREVCFYVKKKFERMGEQMPKDLYHTSHNYLNNGSQNQGGNATSGITPEDARLDLWGQSMDAICSDYGLLGYLIGETGYGTDNDGQHAPDLEGITREVAQGICNMRIVLMLGAVSRYFRGATFYTCRDLFDTGKYDYTGMCTKLWAWKPGMELIAAFLLQWGEWVPVQYIFDAQDNISFLMLRKGGEVKWLEWTNKKNIGILTPNFQQVSMPANEPITQKDCVVQEKKLILNGKYVIQLR